MKNAIDYDFKTQTPTDYELDLIFNVDNSIFIRLFNISKLKYRKTKMLNEFELSPNYYNYATTILKKNINELNNILAKDNIMILTHKVIKGIYSKIKDKWQIKFNLIGTYIKK